MWQVSSRLEGSPVEHSGSWFAKEFYELHIDDIDLNTRLNEVEQLRLLASKQDVPNSLQKTMNTAIQNHNEAVKNTKLISYSTRPV